MGTRTLGVFFVATCFLNVVVGLIAYLALDGSAINGKVENGVFYVGYRGRFTEVSEPSYTFSYWQGVSEIATLVLGFAGAVLLRPTRRTTSAAGEAGDVG